MTDFRAKLDGAEPCSICGKPRRLHWGRRNAMAPHKLGHQWRPAEPHKAPSSEDEQSPLP
jgi:hypothetical protein